MSKTISFSFVSLILTFTVGHAGGWYDAMEKHQFDDAQKEAQAKIAYYQNATQQLTDAKKQSILKGIRIFYPSVSTDMIDKGIVNFFDLKKVNWSQRASIKEQFEPRDRARAFKKLSQDPTALTNIEWFEMLPYACYYNDSFLLQDHAINTLNTLKTFLAETPVSSPALHRDDMNGAEIKDLQKNLEDLLSLMSIDKKITKFQKLHEALNKKIKDLLGLDPDYLSKPFKSNSIVVLIDDFKKNLHGPTAPWGNPAQKTPSPPWKKDDPWSVDLITNYDHGDLMEALVRDVSPQSIIQRAFSFNLRHPHNKDFFTARSDFYSVETLPVVFNCSFSFHSIPLFLKKSNETIQIRTNTLKDAESEEVQNIKDYLKEKHPNERCDGPLSTQQLSSLKRLEHTKFGTKRFSISVQNMVTGPKNDRTHLFIAAPTNHSDSPLVKEGFHNGRIPFLDQNLTKEHALVPLIYDFPANMLEATAHPAGEYKDMAVLVPTSYISILDPQHRLPIFFEGGHSSAAAILSGIASFLRGHYPALNHTDVKKAIAQGANKHFSGYNEKIHGQGMLHVKGAMAVAEQMVTSQPNHNRPLPKPPVANPNVKGLARKFEAFQKTATPVMQKN